MSIGNERLGYNLSKELVGEDEVVPFGDVMPDDMINGSEDFGYISEKVPTFVAMVSGGDARDGYEYVHHHPKTHFDESKLHVSTALYSYYALKWLEQN